MKYLKILALIVLLGAWMPHGTGGLTYFQPLKLGGGGFLSSIDIANDGTKCVTEDGPYGVYCRSPSDTTWIQMINQTTMPVSNFGYYPSIGVGQVSQNSGGTYAICTAPGNSQIQYMVFNGYVFRNAQGVHNALWSLTNFVQDPNLNANGKYRLFGRKCAVDPNNSNVVYIGGSSWLGVSYNGGVTVSYVSTANIPAATPASASAGVVVGSISGTTFTVTSITSGSLAINDVLTCSGCNGPVYIVSGSTPNWVINSSQTVAGGTTITGYLPVVDGIDYPSYNIAFDSTSGTTTCSDGSSPCTKNIYVFSYVAGASNIYATTNGGGTWIATPAGAPTVGVEHMVVAGGVLYVAGDPVTLNVGGLYTYTGGTAGTWTTVAEGAGNIHAVAINPITSAEIVLMTYGGGIYASFNGGNTWGAANTNTARTATDVPWLAWANETYMSAGDIAFDPSNPNSCGTSSNCLIFSEGIGAWNTTPISGSLTTWNSMTAGIEQLVSTHVVVPTSLNPVVGALDRMMFNPTPGGGYPSVGNQVGLVTSITGGYDISFAPNTQYVVSLGSPEGAGNFDYSNYSTNGGITSLPFNSWNTTVASTALSQSPTSNGQGGNLIRVTMSAGAVAGLTTWANGSGSMISGISLTAILNSALTTPIGAKSQGVEFPVTVINSTTVDLQNSTWNAALATTGGNYLFYAPTAPLISWNHTFDIVSTNNSGGAIQVVFPFNNGGLLGSFSNGEPICISGVTGTVEANGCWIIQTAGITSATLFGSTFTNAYVSGGIANIWPPGGGSISASTSTNIVRIPSASSYPLCATDGGLTSSTGSWVTISAPGAPIAVPITGGSWAGNVVTFTTSANAIIPNGDGFEVYGASPSGYNGSFTANATITGESVTAALGSNPGSYVSGGLLIPKTPGWVTNYYLNAQVIAADYVIPNRFYMYNFISGLYQMTSCGTLTLVNSGNNYTNGANGFGAVSGFNTHLKAVPGQAGHIFWSAGSQSGHPGTNRLYRSCDGGTDMQIVTGIFEPISMGFGAPTPGNNYPATYVIGWYSSVNTQSTAVYGIWRGDNDPNNGVNGLCTLTGMNWTQIATATSGTIGGYPQGWMSGPTDISGDPLIYGTVYLGAGSGFMYGRIN